MEWVVTTGRTVTEAQEAALDQLGVDEQEAEVEVVDEPQTGLFGRLKVEARVRARVRPAVPRAKADRRDKRRRSGGNGGGNRKKGNGQNRSDGQQSSERGSGSRDSAKRGRGAEASAPSAQRSGGAGKGTGDERNGPEKDAQQQQSSAAGSSSRSGSSSSSSNRRRRGDGQNQGGSKVAESQRSDHSSNNEAEADVEAQRQAVEEFLNGLVTSLGREDAQVTASVTDESAIEAEVEGKELGLLVGPKGQTLQAVHELTRSVVQRRFVGESHARLTVDVAGYRKRRVDALTEFTRKLADDVVSSGATKELASMSASDRKVVHDTINEMSGVRTFSEGEEPNRRVVIEPA